jgi:hypothetical protein
MVEKTAFERSLGVWEGVYNLLDIDGKLLDRHKSRLEVYGEGTRRGSRNIYDWDDGRREVYTFWGEYLGNGVTELESERIKGEFTEIGDVIVLTWFYKFAPDNPMTEIIRLINDRQRIRCWQFMENGKLSKIMAIEEFKVADEPPPGAPWK